MSTKKIGKENGEKMVLNYLRAQNRPYSAADITSNLHGQIPKSSVVKLLESLCEEGQISMKIFGKQAVYCARQNEVLKKVEDHELDKLQTDLTELEIKLNHATEKLTAIRKDPTDDQLRDQLENLQKKITSGSSYSSTSTSKTASGDSTEEDAEALEHHVKLLRKKNARRTKLAKYIIQVIKDELCDSLGYDKNELDEELGLEWVSVERLSTAAAPSP